MKNQTKVYVNSAATGRSTTAKADSRRSLLTEALLRTEAEQQLGARTWNGAISYASTGVAGEGASLLDYFAKAGTYGNRPQSTVNADMLKIFSENTELATRLIFATRLITRTPKGELEGKITDAQTGMGRKDEFGKAFTWLYRNLPSVARKNLKLIPVFGSWKDLVNEPLLSSLPRHDVYQLVALHGLEDGLFWKYAPTIRTKTRSERDRKRVEWARGLCRHLGISEKEYRQKKSAFGANLWQKQMSRQEWHDIDFNQIPGKALLNAMRHKGKKDRRNWIQRHNLAEAYTKFILSKPVAKFTGYPYELLKAARSATSMMEQLTYDRQWEGLLEPMRNHQLGNVLPALDTSGSMGSSVNYSLKNAPSALDVCLSLGLAFAQMNTGAFKDTVAMFDNTSELKVLSGTFSQRVRQIPSNAMGGTNFQSLIDLLVRTRLSRPDIPVSEYPNTLLVVSDMQFNPSGSQIYDFHTGRYQSREATNYEAMMAKLATVGLAKMRVIWWQVNGAAKDFPTTMSEPGQYLISGFDPIMLKALFGLGQQTKVDGVHSTEPATVVNNVAESAKPENPLQGLLNVLQQPIFDLIEI